MLSYATTADILNVLFNINKYSFSNCLIRGDDVRREISNISG